MFHELAKRKLIHQLLNIKAKGNCVAAKSFSEQGTAFFIYIKRTILQEQGGSDRPKIKNSLRTSSG